jgi:SAM-dependent methyltransferase
MIIDKCPGCNSDENQVSLGESESLTIQVNGRCFCQPSYHINCCNQCGLRYKSEGLSSSELFEYYQNIDFEKWDSEKLFPTEHIIIDALKKLPPNSKILDYGCSHGRLLSRLTNQYQCFGYEISEPASKIASQRGIQIFDDDSFLESNCFDGIILCDVFEHLNNPTSVLEKFSRSLTAGGVLIVCTGNADAWACQNDIADFWYFTNVEHLCMLGRQYADFIAKKMNLELITWKETSHFSLGLYEKIFQFLRFFSYQQFKIPGNTTTKNILRLIPLLKRAEKWNKPPIFWASNDHVVLAYRKSPLKI